MYKNRKNCQYREVYIHGTATGSGTITNTVYIVHERFLHLPVIESIVAYADDTVTLFSGNIWNKINQIVNAELDIIQKWLSLNIQ